LWYVEDSFVTYHIHTHIVTVSLLKQECQSERRLLFRFIVNSLRYLLIRGHAVAQWLRHCATNRKVAGSISDGVTGFFHWHNPSGRTMALGSTQPLTEMSTGIFPGGKGCRCVGLTNLAPSCADCLKIWEPQPPGTLRACQGL
jgi:hypothetical protein